MHKPYWLHNAMINWGCTNDQPTDGWIKNDNGAQQCVCGSMHSIHFGASPSDMEWGTGQLLDSLWDMDIVDAMIHDVPGEFREVDHHQWCIWCNAENELIRYLRAVQLLGANTWRCVRPSRYIPSQTVTDIQLNHSEPVLNLRPVGCTVLSAWFPPQISAITNLNDSVSDTWSDSEISFLILFAERSRPQQTCCWDFIPYRPPLLSHWTYRVDEAFSKTGRLTFDQHLGIFHIECKQPWVWPLADRRVALFLPSSQMLATTSSWVTAR